MCLFNNTFSLPVFHKLRLPGPVSMQSFLNEDWNPAELCLWCSPNPPSLCCLDLYKKHRSSCLYQSFKEYLSVCKFTSNTTPDMSTPSARLPQLTHLDPEGPAQIFFSQKPALIVWFTEEIIKGITLTKFLLILLKLCHQQWWGYVWSVTYMSSSQSVTLPLL